MRGSGSGEAPTAAGVCSAGPRQLGARALVSASLGCLAVLLVAILAFAPAGALAEPLCTDTWTGPGEGAWLTATDWSTGKVPGATDVACIGSGKTVNVTEGANKTGVVQGAGTLVLSGGSLEVASALEASSIAGFSLAGGTLTGSGEVDVTGTFTGSGGLMTGSGALVIESGATGKTVSGDSIYLGRTLNNKGSFTISKESGLGSEESAKFINSGTLTVNGDEKLRTGMFRNTFSGPVPVLLNTGILQRTEGAGQIVIEFAIANNGTVSINTGYIVFDGGGTSGTEHVGSWSTASGSQIRFWGSSSFSLGSSVPMSGSMVVGNGITVTVGTIEGPKETASVEGTLEVNGSSPSTLASLTLVGGYLTGSGELRLTETFGASSGALKGTGVLVIEPSATSATISGNGMSLGRTLINKASFTITNGSGIGGEEAGKFVNDGTLTINGEEKRYTGMFRSSFIGAVPILINAGTIQRTEGTGEIQVEFAFENYGLIDVVTGKIRFTDPVAAREQSTQYGGAENHSAPGEVHVTCGKPVSCATGNSLCPRPTWRSVDGAWV